jgi:mono/diheme cytochrome c family protein
MNSTRHLSEEDLRAMAVYLKGIPANAQPPGPIPDEETLAAGEIVYTVHCGSCHLPSGMGDAGLGVPLVESPIVRAPDPSSLVNVILYGPHLPDTLVVDRSRMKMFGKRLSDADIASVASYVRTEFGNGAGAVTQEQVNAQR